MPEPEHRASEQAHRRIQAVLRAGLGAAVLAMSAGLGVCHTTRCPLRAVRWTDLASSMDLGTRLTTIGIVALALTPAARVLALVVIWARARDWKFAAAAAAVLAVLAAAVLLGSS
jgi:hypothetical protein